MELGGRRSPGAIGLADPVSAWVAEAKLLGYDPKRNRWPTQSSGTRDKLRRRWKPVAWLGDKVA